MTILRVLVIISIFMLALSMASASLEISKIPVNDAIVSELEKPAVFNLAIKNTGPTDRFTIYSLVSGIDIKPSETFLIQNTETKNITINVYFDPKILKNRESISFEYRVTGETSGVTKDLLYARVYNFDSALSIASENIKLGQKDAVIRVKNKISYGFNNLNLKASSEFFNGSFAFSLNPFEEKIFNVQIDQKKLSLAVGGSYILSSVLSTENSSGKILSVFNFEEKSELKTEEKSSGFFVRKFTSRKTNLGSLPAIATVNVKKDRFSAILTTSNVKPSETYKQDSKIVFIFEKELKPSEEFYVQVRTNYFIPMILVALIAAGIWVFIYYVYKKRDLVIRKRVALVRTKRGEFALKVTLYVRALKQLEKVSLMDSIPNIVKLYNRFGSMRPSRIDEINRRVEWDFEMLNKDEERVLSYVIYSKLGIFGRFDLPEAAAVYEENNEIYEVKSNKVVLNFNNKEE